MTPVVRLLLLVNVVAFVLQQTLPGFTEAFLYIPRYTLFRPWTLVTYMFLHDPGGFMHIIFNMLALFFFGPRVEDRLDSKRFTILYFLSGLSGALFSLIFAPYSPILGASAAVFGVMLAFAHFWPHEPIMIWGIVPVPARVLVIVSTVLAIYGGLGSGGGIAHFAHLGGYAGAFIYIRWLDRKKHEFKRKASTPPPETRHRLEAWKSIDLTKVHQVNRDEVSRLIEKVRNQGIGSLTGQERVFLSGFIPPDPPK